MRATETLLGLALLAPGVALAQGPEPAQTDAMRASGRRAAARLATSPASWTSFHAVGPEFLVFEVLQAPPARRRVDVLLERAGARQPVATILERDGRWWVAEAGGVEGLFRPYEAPFKLPGLYAHVAGALRPPTADQVLERPPGVLLGVEGGVATWRRDVPDAEIEAFGEFLAETRAIARQRPEVGRDPAFQERVRWAERLEREYVDGELTRVDVERGLVVLRGAPGHRVALAGFEWLDQVDESRFAVAGEPPPLDASSDPTREAPGDLLMFSHCPWWQPGMSADVVMDARLLELGPRRVRRVAFDGAWSSPGCFSRDRTRVYVCGDEGLFEVDLRTGRDRRLGGAALATGACLFPALSPDGRTLAVVHVAPGADRGQVQLVDLAADTVRPLGRPLMGGALSWLPDGQRLVLVARDAPAAPEHVAVLDASGRLTVLREGSAPAPLPDGRLLFFDVSAGLWRTCDALGRDARLFHDGLPGLGGPALSPDGARAVFVEQRGQGNGLVLVDLTTGRREPLDLGPGLFGSAVWR